MNALFFLKLLHGLNQTKSHVIPGLRLNVSGIIQCTQSISIQVRILVEIININLVPHLLTWINLNSSMDQSSHIHSHT